MKTTLLTIVLALAATLPAAAQTPVRVAEVQVQRLQQHHAVTGSIRATARGQVAALESGRLLKLTVREGETVRRGDVIAEIDSRRLQAQRSAAQADRRVAEAELDRHRAIAKRAAADLIRAKKLISQNAISRQELDALRAAADVATAEIDSTKRQIERSDQAIRLLDVRLSDTRITAPYDASVVARHVEIGDWVQPGDALLTLISTGPVEAWLEVPERYAAELLQGDTIAVESASTHRRLQVLATKRVAEVNRRVRTIPLVATISNVSGTLAPGMSVKGWVPAGSQDDYMTVPKDAVIRRGGQPTVFTVDGTAKAERIAVRVLFETKNRVAVDSPRLKPGSAVVTEGNERLMPEQLVRIVQDSESPSDQIAKR